ncbi:hypothetical protein [Moorena producens]|uniref:hypothetical protein n=1 Tax=Moorena producens TaxID=1155739 RepID=UPI003C71CB48
MAFIITTVSLFTATGNIWINKSVAQTYDANGNFYDHLGRRNQWYSPNGQFSRGDFIRIYGQDIGIFLYQVYLLDESYSICSGSILSDINPAGCNTYEHWQQRRYEIFRELRYQEILR